MAMALEHSDDLETAILAKAQRFSALQEQISTLSAERDNLKDGLREVVAARGVADEKGHVNLPFGRTIGKYVGFQLQRKVSFGYDQEAAEDILTRAGLRHRCFKWVEEIDQEEVMAALAQGLLTKEDIALIFPEKEQFAFVGTKE